MTYAPGEIVNAASENVEFVVRAGKIGVTSRIPGDINGDGKVNVKDLTRLAQYFADWDVYVDENALDTNGDGKVNVKDLTRLAQYFADWDVELH